MKQSHILSTFSFYLAATTAADVSTRPGPFRLVTTASPSAPVVSTGNILLYYLNPEPGVLNLFATPDLFGTDFQLYNGVLGTYTHPDDSSGDLPYNATTPAANTSPAFRNQAIAHAGYDLIDNTFLAIHGVQSGTWWLCGDNSGLQVVTYAASASRSCQATYIAVSP